DCGKEPCHSKLCLAIWGPLPEKCERRPPSPSSNRTLRIGPDMRPSRLCQSEHLAPVLTLQLSLCWLPHRCYLAPLLMLRKLARYPEPLERPPLIAHQRKCLEASDGKQRFFPRCLKDTQPIRRLQHS